MGKAARRSSWRRLLSGLGLLVACLAVLPARAADAGLCVVFKGLFYQQTSPATVVPQPGTDFASFGVFATMTSSGSLLSGAVTNPASQSFALAVEGMELYYEAQYSSQANMDAAFGSGTYRLRLVTRNDGTRTLTLNLLGDTYPPVPQVSNYGAAQAVEPSQPFTLQWNAWAGGAATDFVLVQVEDAETEEHVYASAMPGQPGALDGLATSTTIPAHALAPNRTYRATLMFFRPVAVDAQSYQDVTGLAGYLRETVFTLVTAGGTTDTERPWLEQAAPNYFETNVARNAGIAFKFSEPMQSGHSLSWNVGVAFTYQWSADRTILFCFPTNGLLPANTRIGWTLNPAEGAMEFRDLAGNTLQTFNGFFDTGSATASPDVEAFIIYKMATFEQTGPATVTPHSEEAPYGFGAVVDFTTYTTVTNTTFSGGEGLEMEFEGDGWEGDFGAATLGQVDAAYPPGTYSFTIYTRHDGVRNVSLNLPATALPNAPRVSNFTAAQAVNSEAAFTLAWEAFAGATTNDRIQVEIEMVNPWGGERTVFESVDVLAPDALNGLATGIEIPAHTLPPGRQFSARITFIKIVSLDTTSYPGALGIVAFLAETHLPMATAGEPRRPVLRHLQQFPQFTRFEIVGERETPYRVEYSHDLQEWHHFYNNWSQTGTLVVEDWSTPDDRRFYRVREGW